MVDSFKIGPSRHLLEEFSKYIGVKNFSAGFSIKTILAFFHTFRTLLINTKIILTISKLPIYSKIKKSLKNS